MHHAGLPWWATIISSTLLLRSTFTLPIAIYQQRSLAKMIALAPMVQSWAETLKVQVGKDSRDRGWSYGTYQAELQKQYRKKVNAIYAQYGCSRYKLLLLPYVQIPLFVSMSLTLRHMTAYPLPWFGQTAQSPVQGLDQGGLEPFLDLTTTDPTLILPVLVGAGNLLNVELNAWYAKGVQTPRQKIMTNLFRGLSIAFIPIAAHAPVAISLYWVTSACMVTPLMVFITLFLQQENALLRKQLAPKPSTTDIPPSPSGRTISPIVSSLSRNPLTPFKRFSSPNNAFFPPPKVTHPKRNNSQPSLAAIARQFSSPAEPADFKLIHIPLRHLSFLIHIGYEPELRSYLSKFNITVLDDFDPSIIRDPTLVNELIDYKYNVLSKRSSIESVSPCSDSGLPSTMLLPTYLSSLAALTSTTWRRMTLSHHTNTAQDLSLTTYRLCG
ncbi:hypothetical protein G6F62_008029 [Rhizopus arrhizus]|nr:hypothetical protein G6F23_008825 [Rhizopus arrhizus]KAG1003286.1 hypothetical protein G6F27_011187 [Rhizopus arrhizus]KAG1328695.1 hypothetical protein G6F62_008029 [Rhizopus arrhizus]KAG1407351.1 hypothetical protein G6F58_009680 [Rhizopus delemar]